MQAAAAADMAQRVSCCARRGGLTDGEHYIIVALRVIEDAVEQGVCIQPECGVCLSATPQILERIGLIH